MTNNPMTFDSFVASLLKSRGIQTPAWEYITDCMTSQIIEFANLYAAEVRRKTIEECAKVARDFGDSMVDVSKQSLKSNAPYHLHLQRTAKGTAVGASVIEKLILDLNTLTTNSLGEGTN